MKKGTMLAAVVLAVFGGVINGAVVTVTDFSFFCDTGLDERSIMMPAGTNLMIRDSVTGVDSVVSTQGYWNMGFLFGDAGMVGYAKNSWKQYSGYEGQMRGLYYADLGVGNRPDEVYLIHDVLGDGIGVYDSSNGSWTLGDDDVFYAYDFWGGVFDSSPNILFGPTQIRGDLSTLPALVAGSSSLYLPAMTVSVLPPPPRASCVSPQNNATGIDPDTLLEWESAVAEGKTFVHDVYFGTDPQNLALVSAGQSQTTWPPPLLEWSTWYYWRIDERDAATNELYPGYVWTFKTIVPTCSAPPAADLSGDCVVNLADLAILAGSWLDCHIVPQTACP